jgi:hypothetical protein
MIALKGKVRKEGCNKKDWEKIVSNAKYYYNKIVKNYINIRAS